MNEKSNRKPLRVGLTGGIASGKSTVADVFGELGAIIIDTDVIARDVVQPGKPALDEIRARFGKSLIDTDGQLDRSALRKRIFEDAGSRKDLEAILHPRISAEVRRQAENSAGPYQIIVVPLLVESTLRQLLDRVLVVDCDENTQLQRLLRRDLESTEQAQRILAAQSSREERLAIADDVIRNDSDLSSLRSEVIHLDRTYRDLVAVPDPNEPSAEIP